VILKEGASTESKLLTAGEPIERVMGKKSGKSA